METKNTGLTGLDDPQVTDELHNRELPNPANADEAVYLQRKDERHHYQGSNRKYRMFRNHSSANDQPFTRTDTAP